MIKISERVPVFRVCHDLVRHAVFAAVLETMEERHVRDVLIGRLDAAASHEVGQVILLQLETKVCEDAQEVRVTHLKQVVAHQGRYILS